MNKEKLKRELIYKQIKPSDLFEDITQNIMSYFDKNLNCIVIKGYEFVCTNTVIMKEFFDTWSSSYEEKNNKEYKRYGLPASITDKNILPRRIIFLECKFNEILLRSNFNCKIDFLDCSIEELNLIKDSIITLEINIDRNTYYGDNAADFMDRLFERKSYLGKFDISNKVFNKRFNISNTNIESLIIESCTFNEKFNFRQNIINATNHIHNTNFTEHADFHGTWFGLAEYPDIYKSVKYFGLLPIFKKITFKKMAIFERCNFNELTVFDYVTFESFANFRNATFHKGVVLDTTNWIQIPNFFKVEITDSENKDTTRETYRIIKSSFEGNYNRIEANKFHSLELQKRSEELSKYYVKAKNGLKGLYSSLFTQADSLKVRGYEYDIKDYFKNHLHDLLVFKAQDITSKHASNYFLPIYWIIMTGLIIGAIYGKVPQDIQCCLSSIGVVAVSGYIFYNISGYFFKYFVPLVLIMCIYYLYNGFNIDAFISSISPWSTEIKNHEIAFFFNKIILGYLAYQFLLAIRKDTRK